jgi:hypothetical protein
LKAAGSALAVNLGTGSSAIIANDVAVEAIHEENADDSEDEYVPTPNASARKRKRGPVQVSEEVDAFINAGRLPSKDKCSGCCHKVLIEYFGTDYICMLHALTILSHQVRFFPPAKPRHCCPHCDLPPPMVVVTSAPLQLLPTSSTAHKGPICDKDQTL